MMLLFKNYKIFRFLLHKLPDEVSARFHGQGISRMHEIPSGNAKYGKSEKAPVFEKAFMPEWRDSMDNKQLLLFKEMKGCPEDFSGVDGDGLGEGEVICFAELEGEWIEEQPWLKAGGVTS
jgi:hypothetical protein